MSFRNFGDTGLDVIVLCGLVFSLLESLYAFPLLFSLLFKFRKGVLFVVFSLHFSFFLNLLLKLELS